MLMLKRSLLLLVVFYSFSISLADAVFPYDCQLWPESLSERVKALIWTNEILDVEAVDMALNNLDIYCRSKNYKIPFVWWWQRVPESPYLYDHLADVGFRKLFWDSKTSYWLKLDEQWEKRREQVRKMVEDPTWKSSQQFLEAYASIWQPGNVKGLEYKYKSICDEIYNVRINFLTNYERDKQSQFMTLCEYKTNDIIRKEMTYLKTVMMWRSIKYMKDNINDYASKYFVKTRMDKMIEKFSVLQWYFSVVTQKVSEWTENCNY